MVDLGNIAVLGGGSWATALAKLLLRGQQSITWFMRNPDRIDDFIRCGHNPVYLSDVSFDTDRIRFTSDIDEACSSADTLVVAVPSPYVRSHIDSITVPIEAKNVVSAVKGIIPEVNMIVTDYFMHRFGCRDQNLLVIGGPCHAEEVALERLSYLTIGCHDAEKCEAFASLLRGPRLKTILSGDMDGIEYGAVLKNVYAIAAGMAGGMKLGDNFIAMLVCNAAREMRRFVDTVDPSERDICASAYLGDLLVTAYSRFSRNHNFGAMIGKGYSVQAAKMEMEMVAEGYYGTKCVHDVNRSYGVKMPILDCVYNILYRRMNPRKAFALIYDSFS